MDDRALQPHARVVAYGNHRHASNAAYAGRAGPRPLRGSRHFSGAFGSDNEGRGVSRQLAANGRRNAGNRDNSESMGPSENEPIHPLVRVQILEERILHSHSRHAARAPIPDARAFGHLTDTRIAWSRAAREY